MQTTVKNEMYTCPMHPEVVSKEPGKCPKCGGMDLVPAGNAAMGHHEPTKKNKLSTFLPLIIIFSLLTMASIAQVLLLKNHANHLAELHSHTNVVVDELNTLTSGWHVFMASFMGGFFVIFAGFKLLDVKGFTHGYRTYDLLAMKFPGYGLVYPFIELGLGFMFLLHFELVIVSAITAVLSLLGLVSVARKLRKHETIQCVCLGTVFDLPLTNVTLFENLIMFIMSVAMLALR